MKRRVSPGTIVENRAARHDFFVEDRLEGGLVLQGWEVKALRAGRMQINEGYVVVKGGEAFLVGTTLTPLPMACAHPPPEPQRWRKVLLSRRELVKLQQESARKGYTLVPLKLYWLRAWVKVQIGLCKGKQAHDKRQQARLDSWSREKSRLLKTLG